MYASYVPFRFRQQLTDAADTDSYVVHGLENITRLRGEGEAGRPRGRTRTGVLIVLRGSSANPWIFFPFPIVFLSPWYTKFSHGWDMGNVSHGISSFPWDINFPVVFLSRGIPSFPWMGYGNVSHGVLYPVGYQVSHGMKIFSWDGLFPMGCIVSHGISIFPSYFYPVEYQVSHGWDKGMLPMGFGNVFPWNTGMFPVRYPTGYQDSRGTLYPMGYQLFHGIFHGMKHASMGNPVG